MIKLHKIDADGFLIFGEDLHVNVGETVTKNYVDTPLPRDENGQLAFYKPKWDGEKWIETITGETLELIKNSKINEINNNCNKTVLGRFKATIDDVEYEFSYDYDAQLRFTGIGVLFNANKINEIEWTAYQNNERVRIMLNQDNFDAVTLAALQHQNSNIVKYNQLLQRVNDATTKEQIEAIIWDD